jgi:hypothetical protein
MTTAGPTPTVRPGKPANADGSENCLSAGTRLADFEIIEVLGEGGFGIVYLAFDHALRRTVAVKEFMPSVLAMRGADGAVALRAERHHDTFRGGLKSFINEARLLAQFDHPALVKVHRYWEQNNTAYTAMQYYEGRTIKEIVEHSPELVDQAWCLKMLGQVMQALEVLYTMQIVHRDVSPDNIIVQDNGEAVLLDFGSAREIIGDMTRAVTVILKPGYAPVEQYANDTTLEQGAYTDIYALCAVVYFAITRKAPASSIARMVQDPMVPLATLAPPGYTYAFLAAIDQGLSVLAEDRPRTIPAFRTLLGIPAVSAPSARAAGAGKRFAQDGASDGAGGVPVRATWPETRDPVAKTRAPQSRKRLLVIVAVGVLLIAGAIALTMRKPPAPEVKPLAKVGPVVAAAPVASEPHRTVVSAKDIAGVEEVIEPDALAALVAEQAPAESPATTAPVAPAIPMVPVTLAVKPWGTVFVDGRSRGTTPPLRRLSLPAGTHEIRIVNPAYPPYTTTLNLKKNESAAVVHDFGAAPP